MIDKIKEKIDKNKTDKSVYNEYINAFIKNETIKEQFKDNDDFNSLTKDETFIDKSNNEKEDEFF